MLTENDARALLAQAADTIEVGPATPVEPVRRRAWPVLVAAVGVLVAGVGVWAGVSALDTDAAPAPSVDTPPDQGTVPSVFGHRRAGATQILTDAGLEVRVVERPACDPPGQAIGTLPSTGVRMEPGSVVTLQVAAEGVTIDCYSELTVPWQLLGLATGELESPSLLTGPLTAYVDGERSDVSDASDPAAWGSPSALAVLRAAVDWSPETSRTWRTLEQQEPGCDGRAIGLPRAVVPRQRYAIAYDDPDAPCVQLTVAGEFGERPVEVAVETAGLEVGDPDPTPEPVPDAATVPAVFGLTEGEALKVLEDAGVGNRVTIATPGCLPPGRALGTEPAAGAPLTATTQVRLEVTTFPEDAECTSSQPALFSLLDFARGERPPAFAAEVTTWVDGVVSSESDPTTLRTWGAGSPLEVLLAVAGDARPERVGQRSFDVGDGGSFPAACEVDGVRGASPPAPANPSLGQSWFAYERGGEIRACVVVDVFGDAERGIDLIAVRTVDPDGLLPVRAVEPVGEEASDLASSFVAFATSELSEPMFLADEVRLYDAGDYVRTEPAAALQTRDAWLVCDPAERDSCVGSALEALVYGIVEPPVRSTSQVPSEAPPGTTMVVTVGPPEVTSCQPRGIVSLFVDADEQIVGVDVADAPVSICSDGGLAPPE